LLNGDNRFLTNATYTYNLYDLILKDNEKYFDIFIKLVDIFRQWFKKLTYIIMKIKFG